MSYSTEGLDNSNNTPASRTEDAMAKLERGLAQTPDYTIPVQLLELHRAEYQDACKQEVALREKLSKIEQKAEEDIQKVREKIETLQETSIETRESMDARLYTTITVATDKVAKAGGVYPLERGKEGAVGIKAADAERASSFAIPSPMKPALPILAGGEKIPYFERDEEGILDKRWSNFVLIFVGSILGISVGIMARFLIFDELGSVRALPVLIPCVCFGITVALCVGESVKTAWKFVAERYYFKEMWIPACILASLLSLFPIAMDAKVEQQGLLSGLLQQVIFSGISDRQQVLSPGTGMGAQSSSKPGLNPEAATPTQPPIDRLAALLAALLLSGPYVTLKGWEGFRMGRHKCTQNFLLHRQNEIHDSALAAFRANAGIVQPAMLAIGAVHNLKLQREEMAENIQGQKKFFEDQIAQIEKAASAKTGELKKQMAEVENMKKYFLLGWEADVQELTAYFNPAGSLWKRLKHAFKGYRLPRRRRITTRHGRSISVQQHL